jgi:DNA repair exonuclease SbcCD ATPase subunit
MSITFKTLQWKNFLSTGNSFNRIILNGDSSTLIVGKNGEGKSTILDALTFVLFGKPFRNINKPQLINSINQKNMLVEVEFDVGSSSYKVVRGMKPNVFEIYCNGTIINQDAASRDYQNTLEQQILKLNYKTFTQVVILGSASFVPFMQLPAHSRREVIEDILDISIFSDMNTILKTRIDETKTELKYLESKIDLLKSKTSSQKRLIESMVSSKQDQLDKLRQQIRENEDNISLNLEKHSQLTEKISALMEEMNDEEQVAKDVKKLTTMREKISSGKEQLEENLSFFENNEVCPSCSQGIPHEHKSKITESLLKNIFDSEKKINTLEEAYTTLADRQKRLSDINKEMLALNVQCNSLIASNKTYKQMNEKLVFQTEEIKEDVGDIDEEKSKLQVLAAEALSFIKRKNSLQEQKSVQEVAAILLKDTGIKTAIIKEYLPAMNKLINSYLNAMDFYVHFELDEAFNEKIKSRFRDEFTYASFSEGEKMRLDLAILFTWRQIAKMKNSVNTNLLILDEIFDSSLDVAGTDYFLSIMESFGDKQNVFVISHKADSLVDKFKNTIRFEKRNDFSVIA